jgi:putative ABC transport system permease protein
MSEVKQVVTRLAHRPSFTAAVVLTLALGIGLNALVFSIVEAVLLRPLPYPSASELMAVWETQPGIQTRSVAPANFLDWRAASGFEGMAAFNLRRRSLLGEDPQRITVATVSANFFDVLGVEALRGRTFTAPVPPGTTRGILLREDFWRARFGGDPAVTGRGLRLDDESFVVAGVIPTHLAYPEDAVAWMQAPHDIPELGAGAPTDLRAMRDAWYFRVIGRLRDGVSREQAQGELDAIAARLRAAYPSTNRTAGVNVVALHAQVTGGAARTLWVLFAVAACVLLIACGNVATLLLANALGRSRDLAIRSALGASRWRLVRQLSVESLVLALAGAALGLVFAWVAGPPAAALLPAGVPRTSGVGVDMTVVLFSLAAAVLTAVACGAAPAVVASRSGFSNLRDGGRIGSSRSGSRFAAALVVGQLATALVLVTGTGLLLRAIWQLHQRDVGIDVERLLAIDVTIPDAQSRGRAAAVIDIERMTERLSSLPGVEAAAAVLTLPLAGRGPSAGFRVAGRVFAPGEAPDVIWKVVTPGYFRAVGLPVVRGRGFVAADHDRSQPVALVNATLAAMLWPDGDPIGARVGTGLDGNGAPVVVVGVVADTPQEGVAGEVLPEMYRPLAQPARFGVASMAFVVRTTGEPVQLSGAARQAIRDVHPQAPVAAVRPLADVVAAGVANELTAARALAVFGGLALVLAAIGLYGVMARVVGDRTRELGVRLALGAGPGSVRWLVLRRTFGVVLMGLALGAACAVVASRQLGALLHGVSPADPFVVSAASLVLLAVALLAGYLPARRASRIDPLVVLRE